MIKLAMSLKIACMGVLLMVMFPMTAQAEQTLNIALKTKAGDHDQPFFIVMLLDEKGQYKKTLTVIGDDKRRYRAFSYWWRYAKRSGENIDALSSASVANGTTVERTVTVSDEALSKQYTIRVDAAGYQGEKYTKTAMIKLSPNNKGKKFNGKKFLDFAWVKW